MGGEIVTAAQREDTLSGAVDSVCVWVVTHDGCLECVEREVAWLSPYIQAQVLRQGQGIVKTKPVKLPKQVSLEVLQLLLQYCRYHRAPGRSDKERKLFDEKFIRLDTKRLCELTSAADSLDMKPLVDLTSRALARMIEGKTPEEIRETFHLPDDLTEEEKLEPVKNSCDDPRIRLLNRLNAKRRKDLEERKQRELAAHANRLALEGSACEDTRSVEDLLNFIGDDAHRLASLSGQAKKAKPKRKKNTRRKGDAQEGTAGSEAPPDQQCVGASMTADPQGRPVTAASDPGHLEALFPEDGFDDSEGDVELDLEVEDFARRLNADWQVRRQELMLAPMAQRTQCSLHVSPGAVLPVLDTCVHGRTSATAVSQPCHTCPSDCVSHGEQCSDPGDADEHLGVMPSSSKPGHADAAAMAKLLCTFLQRACLHEQIQVKLNPGDPDIEDGNCQWLMTTRGSLARGVGQQQFQGRVRKWVKKWGSAGLATDGTKLALLRWLPTDERTTDRSGPRLPLVIPLKPASNPTPAGSQKQHQQEASAPPPAALHVDQELTAMPAASDSVGAHMQTADQPVSDATMEAHVQASSMAAAGSQAIHDDQGEDTTMQVDEVPTAAI
ncbi:hypothetical protein WJX72_012316 [[Myrmecia] bisecta]|uniref:SKP1 component dimerisation domain-containing protein n=1 Tax=[Myrmecia] bisecta TaxID=41462 RepID=A0AAW1R9M7_9CHLO